MAETYDTEQTIHEYTKSYMMELKINGEDYSPDLYGVQITSSMSGAYQVFVLKLNLSPEHIMINKIHGQYHIELKMRFYWVPDQEQRKELSFNLMFVRQEYPLPPREQMITLETTEADKVPVHIVTVVREPFTTMTTQMNAQYGAKKPKKTVKEIIEDLVSNTSATLEYDPTTENTDILEQVVVYPGPLYQVIKHLDDIFGLYNGVPFIFCQYDNKLHIRNLTEWIKKPEIFGIRYLSLESSLKEIDTDDSTAKIYATFHAISIDQETNAKTGVLGSDLYHIVKPKDKLYEQIDQTLIGVSADYGLIDGAVKNYTDESLDTRYRFYTEHTGYNDSKFFCNSMIARQIYNLGRVKIRLQRDVDIEKLLDIGQPVLFKCDTIEYAEMDGKYILYSSVIDFGRVGGGWSSDAEIQIVRTNKTKA